METLLYTCPDCDGLGSVRGGAMSNEADCDLIDCPTCGGEGSVDCGPSDEDDGEPAELDSDEGFNPYTGGADDDGYDTGADGWDGAGDD
jgi:hypothetical protein